MTNQEPFIDLYEVLQVSPNVDKGTIERVFRYLAKRYHPDNDESGDAGRFEQVMRAYRILTDDSKRAGYDAVYQRQVARNYSLAIEASDESDLESDIRVRQRILSLLYVKRRRDLQNPGLGSMEIERILQRPREHLEFHLWYLRQKGWMERTENGYLAITADGVEQVEATMLQLRPDRLIEDQTVRVRAAG